MKPVRYHLNLVLTVLLLLLTHVGAAADMQVADLKGEDKVMFDKFRELLQNGSPDDFYTFAAEYEKELHEKGYMMLYYKLLNNEGFYALRHNMTFRAMQQAERLDRELRDDGAGDYYYLATGLMGDIYYACHDREKAERYFVQALDEVGDRDPKFTMRVYQSLAEMLSINDPQKALQWTERAVELSQQTNNVEYYSMSLAMTAYIHFLHNNSDDFFQTYHQYVDLRSMEKAGFSHRYDKIIDIAKMAFEGDYDAAIKKMRQKGTLYVDSTLVAIRIYAMSHQVDKGFQVMLRHYVEMDSIYSLTQNANFDQMAIERSLMESKKDAEANARKARTMGMWLLVVVVVFLFIYILGRRRLVKHIKEQNKELNVALAKAEESDRMKQAFIASMSHEIRTPLNAVAGFSQLLCTPGMVFEEEEKRDIQERITTSVSKITRIIDEVLALSKDESEHEAKELEKTNVPLNALGRSSLRALKGRVKPGVKLRFATNVKDDYTLHTNEDHLRDALGHLLDNSTKFTEEGYIELRFVEMGNEMRISVTDTGCGIDQKQQDYIFEKFSKGDDFKEGVGLGLTVCHRLVTELGGKIELDKYYEKGCRFMITLYME